MLAADMLAADRPALDMPLKSAGLLLYRRVEGRLEILLVHPGGPFWAKRDLGAWSIPKGEYDREDPVDVARREFREETGGEPPAGPWLSLGDALQPSRKLVTAFAGEGAFDPASLVSNEVGIEWPPRSGLRRRVPEVDRAAWFAVPEARDRILPGQRVFIDRLVQELGHD